MIDDEQIKHMVKQIKSAGSSDALDMIKEAHLNSINSAISETIAQQAKITELYAPLLTVPTDLGSVINWIKSMTTNIAEIQIENAVKYTAELAKLNSAVDEIETAVKDKLAS